MGLQARQVSVIATPAKVDVIHNIKSEAEQGVQLYYTKPGEDPTHSRRTLLTQRLERSTTWHER